MSTSDVSTATPDSPVSTASAPARPTPPPSQLSDDALIPGAGYDLTNADVVADLFKRAAEANVSSPLRQGAVDVLPRRGTLVMTGDLHDHSLNFQRVLKLARPWADAKNHLVLHEVIHGPHRINGMDLSVRTLARLAVLKVEFPDQIHLLQSNHELAQMHGPEGGRGILKDGVSVVEIFDRGMEYIYGDEAEKVRDAMCGFIRSYALAIKCPKGVMCSHSLPGDRVMKRFDPEVLDRVPTDEDLASGGSGYVMVWGRGQSQELTDKLADAWGVNLFLVGHQAADMGYDLMTRNMIVLASDHEHGMALPLDLSKRYDSDKVLDEMVALAGIEV